MAEAENFQPESGGAPGSGLVAVIVPLFPRLPGLRQSLASLAAQTRPPDLVVLLDDGKTLDAESLRAEIPGLASEVLQTGTESLPAALNATVQYLAGYEFLAFLQAGDHYAPERIGHCLAALRDEAAAPKPPAVVITGLVPVDSRGNPLTPEDPRAAHLARLWAPGGGAVTPAEWLGTGNIAATASNLFLRREVLAEEPLPDATGYFPYFCTISAAVQGTLSILSAPLLLHNPVGRDQQTTIRSTTEMLWAQFHLLTALKGKLAVSPETRHNFAAFHRTAWNNLSGLREDLFQQAVLRLASGVRTEEIGEATTSILRSHAAQSPAPQQRTLLEGGDPLDFVAYVSALERTRDQLAAADGENRRLRAIAEAAQGSGWVRWGAWLGDRSARRMMELDENDGAGPADAEPNTPST